MQYLLYLNVLNLYSPGLGNEKSYLQGTLLNRSSKEGHKIKHKTKCDGGEK